MLCVLYALCFIFYMLCLGYIHLFNPARSVHFSWYLVDFIDSCVLSTHFKKGACLNRSSIAPLWYIFEVSCQTWHPPITLCIKLWQLWPILLALLFTSCFVNGLGWGNSKRPSLLSLAMVVGQPLQRWLGGFLTKQQVLTELNVCCAVLCVISALLPQSLYLNLGS